MVGDGCGAAIAERPRAQDSDRPERLLTYICEYCQCLLEASASWCFRLGRVLIHCALADGVSTVGRAVGNGVRRRPVVSGAQEY